MMASQVGTLSLETLKKYNAADLDPYTVQLAQTLCERFTLSQVGYRNLSDTFSSLPGIQVFEQNFEVGYGQQHPVPSILSSDSGSVLAAIVGSLAEAFTEKVVVDFFVILTKRSKVARANQPTPEQWRRMIEIFYGILMPSTFGFYLTSIAAACPPLNAEPDAERILKALDKMSERRNRKGDHNRAWIIEAGSEAVYLTAASIWLFGLNTTVSTIANEVIYNSSMGEGAPSIEIQLMPQRTVSMMFEGLRLSPDTKIMEQSRTSNITGGRVSFERLFETCLGSAFRAVSKDTLSSFVCCASNIIQYNHQHDVRKLQGVFLPQAAAQNENDRHSLKETIFAWFPEIRRLSSKFERHAQLTAAESKLELERATQNLQEHCQCALCHGGTDFTKLCHVSVALLVVKMGLSVARTVLLPRVFPKQSGVMAMYDWCQAQYTAWRECGTTISASEYFSYHVLGALPASTDLLRTACVLFTAADPAVSLAPGTELMGASYRGFGIFLTGFVDLGDTLRGQARAVSVRVMPGWLCPFGHEMKLEVYDPAFLGLTFKASWDLILTSNDLGQILKRKGDIVMTSIVHKGTPLEEQAKLEGWLLVDDYLGG